MIRKLIGITAIYLSVSLCGLAQTERIVILHTNDTHSQMEPFAATHKTYGGLGGVMRRMAIIDSIRNAEPNVLLVDAGDAIQGTPYFNLFKGDAEFEAMNAMRYDIRTIGNHEFDAGMTKLAQLIKTRQPILSLPTTTYPIHLCTGPCNRGSSKKSGNIK